MAPILDLNDENKALRHPNIRSSIEPERTPPATLGAALDPPTERPVAA
jgi:hypothetical protein